MTTSDLRKAAYAMAQQAGIKQHLKELAYSFSSGKTSSLADDSPLWYQGGGGSELLEYLKKQIASQNKAPKSSELPRDLSKSSELPRDLSRGISKIKAKSIYVLGYQKGDQVDWNRVNKFVFAVNKFKCKSWKELQALNPADFNAVVTQFEYIAREKEQGRFNKYVDEFLKDLNLK